jgi:hypothetical protein
MLLAAAAAAANGIRAMHRNLTEEPSTAAESSTQQQQHFVPGEYDVCEKRFIGRQPNLFGEKMTSLLRKLAYKSSWFYCGETNKSRTLSSETHGRRATVSV